MREAVISRDEAKQRLDRYIEKVVRGINSSQCQKYIRKKRIRVNGRHEKADYRLREGDVLELYINDELFEGYKEADAYKQIREPRIEVIYEDRHILLANKGAGMLTHSDGKEVKATLIAQIQAYLYQKGEWSGEVSGSFRPSLCNRIDRNTSGIVIAAKSGEALREMNERIREREVEKRYKCIVQGVPEPSEGILEGYIFKDAEKNRVYVRAKSEKGTKYAATRYRVEAVREGKALLECSLITGRTHQIRAQLANAGYPLLGDGKYGSADKSEHQALCAYKVAFKKSGRGGLLTYLEGQSFEVGRVDFMDKFYKSK